MLKHITVTVVNVGVAQIVMTYIIMMDYVNIAGGVDIMNSNKPNHYQNDTFIDVIDFCNIYKLDFIEGNIIKYIVRYKKKDGIKDLEKALVYLNRLIDIASIK